jgi:hypothetical protein
MTATPIAAIRDFEFFYGSWTVRHRRLKERLVGSADWDEFAGTSRCWGLLGGMANVDDNHMPERGIRGMSLRILDPVKHVWSIWWVNAADGVIQPLVIGGFAGGEGLFRGDDVFAARPIKVIYRWSAITPTGARWEQAFSADDGRSWETNWIMDFTRAG